MDPTFLPIASWHQLVAELEFLVNDETLGGKIEEALAAAGVLPESIRGEVEAAD